MQKCAHLIINFCIDGLLVIRKSSSVQLIFGRSDKTLLLNEHTLQLHEVLNECRMCRVSMCSTIEQKHCSKTRPAFIRLHPNENGKMNESDKLLRQASGFKWQAFVSLFFIYKFKALNVTFFSFDRLSHKYGPIKNEFVSIGLGVSVSFSMGVSFCLCVRFIC